jgi:hypothetical protein
MTPQTLAFVALALELLRDPQHRDALIRLAASAHALPTRWRASSRTGEGMGQGATGKNLGSWKRRFFACRFRGDASI